MAATIGDLHVAVLAFPFGSHAAPLLTLVRRLAASVPNVIFSFFNTQKSNEKIFSRTEIDGYNIKPFNVDDGVPMGHVFSGNPLEGVELFLKAMPENFRKGVEEAVAETGKNVTCLLTDAFLWFSGDMAEQMGVPWVAFWTAGPCSISVHVYVDLIRSTIGLTGREENAEKTLEFIPGLSSIHAKDLPEGVLYGNLESPFSHLLYKMGQEVPRATAVVLNSFEEIDPIVTNDLKTKLQKVLNVGPFTLASPPPSFSDPSGCIPWLDRHETSSVAYLSFGTILTPPPNELIALAEAFQARGVPFLWSLRDTSKQHLLESRFERIGALGKIVPWAPQLQVLEHPSVGVFMTHCGWNSVSESIAGGVPMICRPFFGDQSLNRRFVEDVWKIGVKVEGGVFTKSGTIKALDLVLSKEEGKKMRDNIGLLKENARIAVGPNGSSIEKFSVLLELVTNS